MRNEPLLPFYRQGTQGSGNLHSLSTQDISEKAEDVPEDLL